MLKELIESGRNKLGSYEKLAVRLGVRPPVVSEWKAGTRKPDAFKICYMAEIVGLNPLDTLAKVQAELDKDNSNYWNKWCAQRDSNARPLPSEGSTLSS